MTTATDNQFDVDRCVNEDGGACEIRISGDPWIKAHLVGNRMDSVSVFEANGRLYDYDVTAIRNIQPKPRMLRLIIGLDHNCVPIIHRVGGGNIFGVGHTMPVDACEVTINLDTCEQVEPDVMTVDELRTEHLIYIELDGGRWRICQCIPIAVWDGVKMNPSHDSSRYFDTHRAAQIEATRIAREGKHNA